MPELTQEAVHQFWQKYQDPMIYRVICFMEGVEDWTLDGDTHLEQALGKLGKELDDIANVDMSQLGKDDLFIRIGAYLKSGRCLRLLHAVDTAHPGAASKILIHAEEVSKTGDEIASLFLRRNVVFERLRLLARVFATERLTLILNALEGEDRA